MDMNFYIECEKKSGIKVGDKVRIIGKAEFGQGGWRASWVKGIMDKYIGQTAIVAAVSSHRNPGPGAMGVYCQTDDGQKYFFPYFVLEIVPFVPILVKLNGDYAAYVKKENVVVGCQTFSFEAVKNLYEAVVQMEGGREG